jgi:hypothetical protein
MKWRSLPLTFTKGDSRAWRPPLGWSKLPAATVAFMVADQHQHH